jgi:hypothetical protein
VNLDFGGTGDILAAEQDRGLQRVLSRPSVVPIAEGMREAFQHPIQVESQIIISFDRTSHRRRLKVQVIVVHRLWPGIVKDLFEFCGGRITKEKSSFIDFSHPEERIGTRAALRPFEFSPQREESVPGGLEQVLDALLERVRC